MNPFLSDNAGKLAAAIGHLTKLNSLTLRFGYDTAMTYRGISEVAVGLLPLQHTLESLTLDFGYVAVTTPPGKDPVPAFACLGIFLGGCRRLGMLDLDLDCDVNDDESVRALGVHVACLPVTKMKLPGFQVGRAVKRD